MLKNTAKLGAAMIKKIIHLPRKFVMLLIRGYQKTFSPDHGLLKVYFPHGYCKFNPSCSQYGYEAVEKYGVIKGSAMAAWRIMRCNPWNKGGEDPLK